MRLSKDGVSALYLTLAPAALAVILLFSSNTFAQHSGGGGGSSGGASSSGGGGGGSHGGSSGGSVSSGGGHSSGGGSSSHSSAGHSSSAGSASSHSGTSHSNTAHSNTVRPNHAPNKGAQGKTETSQKRGFFSFLRHHVPKPETKPAPTPKPTELVGKVRPPICLKEPCPICPAGGHGVGGCERTDLRDRNRRVCPAGEYWAAGGCLQQTFYQDECGGLRTMMERQAKRAREAEQDRQISCVLGPRQQCSDFTSSAESEAGFYQELQNRYQACQRRSPTGPRYNGFRVPGYSAGVSFDSLGMGMGHR
jgi:hypothetical protein